MLKFLNKKKNNKGFTLVELVIVIAILAILVGLLAPQYTKYVEKSRKSADASNMDEMVKVVKVFAADPANELQAGDYIITMTHASGTTLTGDHTAAGDALHTEMDESIPNWTTRNTKSQKWGTDGAATDIIATVTVNEDGGTEVAYTADDQSDKFTNYMATGSES